jgi:hypothetical protein
MLTFEEQGHVYRWNGTIVPSVTSILKPISGMDQIPEFRLEPARRRGNYVHRMTQLYDEGRLDEATMARTEYDCEWFEIEKMGYSEQFGFAGTWDRLGLVNTLPSLIDVKTALEDSPSWGVQTAAYRQILIERAPSAALLERMTVQLAPDGTYQLIPWNDPHDWNVFLSLLTIRNWRAKHEH